jgi:hypothetical protein
LLFGRVIIPQKVFDELQQSTTPSPVKAFAASYHQPLNFTFENQNQYTRNLVFLLSGSRLQSVFFSR